MSYNTIPDCLATARPTRSARRAVQLGIDNGPNKLAAPPVQQPVQVGIKFAHDGKATMAMVLSVGPNTIPIPMTPEGWEELAAAGDGIADQLRAIIAAGPVAEPEPVIEYGPEEQAEKGRFQIEATVNNYGRAVVSKPMMSALFRHSEHARNWARKHNLDLSCDVAAGNVTFSPASLEPAQALPPEMAYEKPYILPV
jgi:hypothetical protein